MASTTRPAHRSNGSAYVALKRCFTYGGQLAVVLPGHDAEQHGVVLSGDVRHIAGDLEFDHQISCQTLAAMGVQALRGQRVYGKAAGVPRQPQVVQIALGDRMPLEQVAQQQVDDQHVQLRLFIVDLLKCAGDGSNSSTPLGRVSSRTSR